MKARPAALRRTAAVTVSALLACGQLTDVITLAQRGTPQLTPARDSSTPTAGAATIRGRVVSGDGNVPLHGALITVTVPGQRLPITALVADGTGRYQLTGLPAGRYPITASRPAYIRLAYGQTRPAQSGKPIVVTDRQVLEN